MHLIWYDPGNCTSVDKEGRQCSTDFYEQDSRDAGSARVMLHEYWEFTFWIALEYINSGITDDPSEQYPHKNIIRWYYKTAQFSDI